MQKKSRVTYSIILYNHSALHLSVIMYEEIIALEL